MKEKQLVTTCFQSTGRFSLLLCLIVAMWAPNVRSQSVLRQSVWVKIGVTKSGVVRLTQSQLTELNSAFAVADPRRFRLYGNGGAMLPQPNATSRPTDLTENAIQVTGEADGRFDAADAVLFFGQSPHVIQYDSTARRFTHQKNVYTDTTFYFLTIGSESGLRIADQPVGKIGSLPTVTTFDDYQFYEPDLNKLPSVHSGREWFGDYMTIDTTKTVSFESTGAVANAPVKITASAMAGALVPTQFLVRLNDQLVGSLAMATIQPYEYDYQGVARTDTFLTNLASLGDQIRLSLTYRKNESPGAQGYFNYLAIQMRRDLRQYSTSSWVRQLAAGQYAIKQATASLRIWDVTNPLMPVTQLYTLSSAQEASWSAARSGNYFLFTDEQLVAPASLMTIPNQDLHSQSTPDLLIVSPVAWRAQADRLADFRRTHDQLSVLVVTTQQVYNEFGSGQADPTALRDMARYFYMKAPDKLRYLLLFGDATYNYRNIANYSTVSAAELANMVPVYESRESLHPVLSYSSDDYFGFMDSKAGDWPENTKGDYAMNIGVGRLPVRTFEEAQTIVDKLIRYSTDATLLGDWQTKVMLLADDGDDNLHQQDADQMARLIEKIAPAYRPERVFLDDYPQENIANEQKAPEVNQLITQNITDGRLIINYSGHGGVDILADEQIVTIADIESWRNTRLPIFVTATCQFGRYDDPATDSGAELILLSRTGGGIGLLTTARPVYANTNLLLNEAFYNAVFKPINGQMPRMGDVTRITKNNSLSGPVNRNFALLGDPSMQLAYPQAQAVLTQVNGKLIASNRIDTLKALQTVSLAGEIQQNNQRVSNFTGTIRLSLYDKRVTHTTLGSDAGSSKMTYQSFSNPIFTGQVAVQQGQFTVRFTMPKDIDYTVGQGKLYLYAVRADSALNASGSYDSLRVGGDIAPDSIDNQPPSIALSVAGGRIQDDRTHVSGPDVTLHINLTDNRGINIARSGIGHELTAQLANQAAVVLNESYVSTSADGRQGQVDYTFRNVTSGTYTIQVKAWDINNNSSEGTLTIVVSDRPGLAIQAFRASPNPLVDQSTLLADINRSGEPLDWTWRIYDLNSRLLSQQSGQYTNSGATVNVGTWNGLTDAGQPLQKGLYIIRLEIRSGVDGTTAIGTSRILLAK